MICWSGGRGRDQGEISDRPVVYTCTLEYDACLLESKNRAGDIVWPRDGARVIDKPRMAF